MYCTHCTPEQPSPPFTSSHPLSTALSSPLPQLATGVQDLGLLYPVPYFEAGTTVLVIVNSLDQPRSSQGQSLKWSTVSKLCRKKSSTQVPASVLQVAGPIPDRLALDAQVSEGWPRCWLCQWGLIKCS